VSLLRQVGIGCTKVFTGMNIAVDKITLQKRLGVDDVMQHLLGNVACSCLLFTGQHTVVHHLRIFETTLLAVEDIDR